jgi:hypothetical protein
MIYSVFTNLPVDNGGWGVQKAAEGSESPSSNVFVPVYIQLAFDTRANAMAVVRIWLLGI